MGSPADVQAYIVRDDDTRFCTSRLGAHADYIAEHQVVHTEATADKPSTTSCFLESEEGSVSHTGLDGHLRDD
jgi:hypothetical protein